MEDYDDRGCPLWHLTEGELEYFSQFSDLERIEDREDLHEFLGIVGSWDPMIIDNPLHFNFFEANDFNYSINKILHK